jgi:fibronectin type 3 domain-containing protein
VFDGNLSTFYDAVNGSGDWAGLDLGIGSAAVVSQIKYCPRGGFAGRMVGGQFQGANVADFSSGVVTLFTITTTPAEGVLTARTISNPTAFRYLRYLGPANGFCNVAEVEFWSSITGTPPPAAPTGLAGTGSSQQIALSWNVSSGATSYRVKRSTTSGGPYTAITNVSSTSFTDTALPTNRLYYTSTYYYVVSALSGTGEGANSAQVAATMPPAAPTRLTATADQWHVALWWDFPGGADSYNVKRSATRGGPYVTITNVVNNNFVDPEMVNGTNYYYVVSALNAGGESVNSAEATMNPPFPWMSREIGSGGGSVYFTNGVFTVSGSGADIWGNADAFRFVYVPVTGNCTIVARVASLQDTDPWSKAGVMIRESLDANSANAFIGVTPSNGVTFQYRSSTGGNSANNNTTGFRAPYWVRLVRSGNSFTGYRSPNGVTWTQQGTSATISMASAVYVGLAITAHNGSSLSTATFDNVTAPGWSNWTVPPAPSALSGLAENGHSALTWASSANATSYNIKRSTTDGGPYNIIANATTTNFTDVGLTNGVTYYYVVSALNPAGESGNSFQLALSPRPTVGLMLTGTNLTLSWPLASEGFTLQWRTNLFLGEWENVTSPAPEAFGDEWQLVLPVSESTPSIFYRLVK